MFQIGPEPALVSDEVLALARKVFPSTLGHLTERGFANDLQPVSSADRIVGTAYTVRIADGDSTAVHYAVDHIKPGHVIVVDMAGNTDRACIGAMVAFTAKARGAAGIIVDGRATDIADIREVGLPVFARGSSALTTSVLGFEGDVNVPITVGAATVTPGQIVLADPDGIVFISPDVLLAMRERVISAQEREIDWKRRILAGEGLSSLTSAESVMEGKTIHL